MSKNTVINIWNEHDWLLEDEMLATCLRVAARHQHAAEQINIYPQERVPDDAPAWKNPRLARMGRHGQVSWRLVIDDRGHSAPQGC